MDKYTNQDPCFYAEVWPWMGITSKRTKYWRMPRTGSISVIEVDLDLKPYGCGIYSRNSCENCATETSSAYITEWQSLNAK